MFLAQMEREYKLESIASNPRERCEERSERKKARPDCTSSAQSNHHTQPEGQKKRKEKLSNAGGKEDLEDLQPNDQREHISHTEQAVFHLRHEVLHFF
jgi:hypothetical protein